MGNPIRDVPWGNLWRWVVSSLFFFFVLVIVVYAPIAFVTRSDLTSVSPVPPHVIFITAGAIVAAIVVWSEDIPWPGDPERDRS